MFSLPAWNFLAPYTHPVYFMLQIQIQLRPTVFFNLSADPKMPYLSDVTLNSPSKYHNDGQSESSGQWDPIKTFFRDKHIISENAW